MKLPPRHDPTSLSNLKLKDPQNSQQRSTMQNVKSKRKWSSLEKLPTEILLNIFLFAINLELPRASPVIAGKLSSEHVFLQTILGVFDPTWDYRFGLVHGDYQAFPESDQPGDPKLQSALLRCRFATLARLRKAEDVWLRRAATERALLSTGKDVCNFWYHAVRLSTLVPVEADHLRWWKKTTDDKFFDDFSQFVEVSKAKYERWHWSGLLFVHPYVEIPDSLLQGPWTEEMMLHLYWMIRASATIRWEESTSSEVAIKGLHTAIKTGNVQAMTAFMKLGLGDHVTLELLIWSFTHTSSNEELIAPRLMEMFIWSPVERYHLDLELSRMEMNSRKEGKQSQLRVQNLRVEWERAKDRWR
jgi:hypothetical protein